MKQLIVALLVFVSAIATWGMTPSVNHGVKLSDIKTVGHTQSNVPDKQGRTWFIEKVE